MSDDLVTRAKAAMAEHEAYVTEHGGVMVSRGLMPELVARIEEQAATIARLEGERDEAREAYADQGGLRLRAELQRMKAEARAQLAEEWRDHDKGRAEAAEAQVAALVEALEAMRGKAISLRGEQAYREFSRYVEKVARAGIAAAKEGA